jgi:FkbM family methyltransferase
MIRRILREAASTLLGRFGREIRKKHEPWGELQGAGIATIIDGGANDGTGAVRFRELFPNAEIHSFEPLPHLFGELKTCLNGDSRFFPYEVALGDRVSKATLEVNSDPYSSSLIPMAAEGTAFAPKMRGISCIDVNVTTLDQWASGRKLPGPLLLKLDLEGYELAALRGAEEFLSQADYVLIEVSFVLLRAGQPTFSEIHGFLESRGFRMIDVFPGPHLDAATGRALWADVLFAGSTAAERGERNHAASG